MLLPFVNFLRKHAEDWVPFRNFILFHSEVLIDCLINCDNCIPRFGHGFYFFKYLGHLFRHFKQSNTIKTILIRVWLKRKLVAQLRNNLVNILWAGRNKPESACLCWIINELTVICLSCLPIVRADWMNTSQSLVNISDLNWIEVQYTYT